MQPLADHNATSLKRARGGFSVVPEAKRVVKPPAKRRRADPTELAADVEMASSPARAPARARPPACYTHRLDAVVGHVRECPGAW